MPARALPPLSPPVSGACIDSLAAELDGQPALELLRHPADLARLSRDFNDYSPVLQPLLAGCRAQLVVRALSVQAVMQVAAACARHGVPLTVRGAGTGNYGQCVPLAGGVVLDLSGLTALRQLDPHSGVVTVEAGCVLADLDRQLAPHGRALRLLPSTFRSATVGGFLAGGSGGIGSLRWGFLRDPGHLLGLEVVTLEPQPRLLQLDAEASTPLNHAYGSNGIITAVRLSTCAAVAWQQLVVGFESWEAALAVGRELPTTALLLNALTLVEGPLAAGLPWPGGCPAASVTEPRLLLLAAPDTLEVLPAWLLRHGGRLLWQAGLGAQRGHGVRELGWNHTTLHWRAHYPEWTYLQMLLPEDPAPLLSAVRQGWGDGLLWHLEAVRQQGQARLAGLPVLRWQGQEQLQSLIDLCRDQGAMVFDPHVVTVEDGGLGVIDADQVAAKGRHDPAGLLNPGKLRGWSAPPPDISRIRG